MTSPVPRSSGPGRYPTWERWLEGLPEALATLRARWELTLGPSVEGTASVVHHATLPDGSPATLKLGYPHMEAEHEIEGLRFWAGEPTVRLYEADSDLNAMLLERCEPGTPLSERAMDEQDIVLADRLRRLWHRAPPRNDLRPLEAMLRYWRDEALAAEGEWVDPAIVEAGLTLFEELPASAVRAVLLATDLHAGNVLSSEREPWLVIDPKPFVGDPAYDATQHLLNGLERLEADPHGTIDRFSVLLDVDPERVRLWTFARAAASPWRWDDRWLALARSLAP